MIFSILWRLEFSVESKYDTGKYKHINNPTARSDVLKLIGLDLFLYSPKI